MYVSQNMPLFSAHAALTKLYTSVVIWSPVFNMAMSSINSSHFIRGFANLGSEDIEWARSSYSNPIISGRVLWNNDFMGKPMHDRKKHQLMTWKYLYQHSKRHAVSMMTSLHGNAFRITGLLRGINRWPADYPHKGSTMKSYFFDVSLNSVE